MLKKLQLLILKLIFEDWHNTKGHICPDAVISNGHSMYVEQKDLGNKKTDNTLTCFGAWVSWHLHMYMVT
jgi:hypothetical protein